MMKRVAGGVAVLIATGMLLTPPAAVAEKKAEIGKAAPGFELPDSYGKKFKLSEFKGKVVVLEWINQNCPVSVRKHNDKVMQDTIKKYADQGVVWLGIDSTWNLDAEKNRHYAAKKGLAYPILNDPEGRVGRAYGARTTPHMFVIGKDGKLVYDGAIDGEKAGKKKQNYVADALEAAVNDSTVARAKTEPYGCGVKYKKK